MNEIETKYRLLCDRLSCIVREDRGFAEKWGGLLLPFEEIDSTWREGYTDLDTYEKLTRAIAENADGRFYSVRDALDRANKLIRASHELISGQQRTNRIAEIKLRLICRTLNECFPSDTPKEYVWGPAFDVLELPCQKEDGKDYEHCVKTADGDWLCPAGASTEESEFLKRGYFSFNSKEKATFAGEKFSGLFRDWLDTELGYRRVEL